MDHEIPRSVSEAQRSQLPRPPRIIKCEPHVPRWLIIVNQSLLRTLDPHSGYFIGAQARFSADS